MDRITIIAGPGEMNGVLLPETTQLELTFRVKVEVEVQQEAYLSEARRSAALALSNLLLTASTDLNAMAGVNDDDAARVVAISMAREP